MRTQKLLCASLALAFLLVTGCPKAAETQSTDVLSKDAPQGIKQECNRAARRGLGPQAEVLRCGDISGSGGLEALAVLRLTHPPREYKGVLVSRLVIIRRRGSEWTTELDLGKHLQNPEGYVATDFIDDSAVPPGYRIQIADHRTDGVTAFDLWIERPGRKRLPGRRWDRSVLESVGWSFSGVRLL